MRGLWGTDVGGGLAWLLEPKRPATLATVTGIAQRSYLSGGLAKGLTHRLRLRGSLTGHRAPHHERCTT